MTEPLHVAMIRAHARHQQACREEFIKLDLSEGQPKILFHLLKHDGCLQKELSAYCQVSPATMTSLLQNMLSKGLVYKEQVQVSGGKRGFLIYLTDLGRDRARKVCNIMGKIEEESLEGFSADEKNKFIEFLARMEQNLTNHSELC